jgi:hypothetical protein
MASPICTDCGTAIHADTASLNSGLCMRCAKRRPPGAEERRNATAARWLAEHGPSIDQSEADARQRAFQAGLSERVRRPGGNIDLLSKAERRYFLLHDLAFQLREGGVFSFFDNSAGNNYLEVAKLLSELGLTRMAVGLAETKALLFGDHEVPRDVNGRRKMMPVNRDGEPKQQIRKALATIDARTDNAEAEIDEKMEEIARANHLY